MSQSASFCDKDPESLPLEEALRRILSQVQPSGGRETLPLKAAAGRVLADALHSALDVPPERVSAMDGYAVRFADLPATAPFRLPLAGKSLAGHPFAGALPEAQAVRITTGAVVPEGADTIIIQEVTEQQGGHLHVHEFPRAGQYVRAAGSDIQAGSTLLPAHTALSPAALGLAAAAGYAELSVVAKPRVAVFSTGDELVAPGHTAALGQIYDSNSSTLYGLLMRNGCDVDDLGIVRDTPEALDAAFVRAASADVIISTGGVSVGEADFVKDTLARHGRMQLWKIAVKPGKPLTFGVLDSGALFFGLPGNPVSGVVTFALFVRPALQRLQGLPPTQALSLPALCTDTLRKAPGRREFQRGILRSGPDGRLQVSTTGEQESHILSSLRQANCFVVLSEQSDGARPGDQVSVIPFSELGL
ncbi:molybdopterin molybdotransferase MoeA [Granulosicoccaceae sp. 1_MG-2023]|nr:molybdopterin molybdotransferase MoeA [Granulosicoccaceae sp. 1_MG-2023]